MIVSNVMIVKGKIIKKKVNKKVLPWVGLEPGLHQWQAVTLTIGLAGVAGGGKRVLLKQF